jgi:DNA polymerase-3 subunit alpha
MSSRFVHLRLHSEFSVVDGLVRIDDAVQAAALDGQGALALTDSANLFGAVRFYKAARAKGVKPILGSDLWISNDVDRDHPYRLLLLVQDRGGYLNLCELLSRAWLTNQHRNRAEVRAEWLGSDATRGLIALSGGAQGEVGVRLLAGDRIAARAAAQRLAAAFSARFYLELQRAGRNGDDACVNASLSLANELKLPVVATHPVQFVARDEFRAHEARVCIAEGYTLADPRRPRRFTAEQYFKTAAEMSELFRDIPAALQNSVEIARRCNLQLTLGQARLPDFPTPPGVTLDEHCRRLALAGLERRLERLFPNSSDRDRQRSAYVDRLEWELDTIAKMGFSGYFLIVADFINWAKENAIPVGPGRGSGAGSLVAYSLNVTDLDPLRYELLFERFLNPERVSMPDFDIDFCQDNRDRVIDYVKHRYGAQAVSQIATFGTLGAKAVVRDVGRVLDLPYTKCDTLSKLIPHNPADPWTLQRALEQEPAFADAVKADEEYGELVELSKPLEGLTRNVGMHAGGVLIAPGKLTDFCPLYCAQGTDAVVSQFDKDDVEAIGLVKFDFLGLTTLTILDLTLRYVKRLDPASTLILDNLPLDDAKTYDIFKRAETTAVFQFDSAGMRGMLKRAKPNVLEDLIALNALYRPGPMDLIPEFIECKHGRKKAEYLDPRLEPILGPTYGVMTYQEHVMTIAQVIGGYTLGGADVLRRAMGKKKPDEMAKQRAIFLKGAVERGLPENKAQLLFDQMEKFAGYGFNKSHSAAYALIAYQTAYLKAHHSAAFMAANLTALMGDTDSVKGLIEDSRALGLTVEAPNVNLGAYRFEPVDVKAIRYGLGAIKGTGQGAIEHIISVRSATPFGNLFEFCARIDRHIVNRRVVEVLVRAGGFDSIDADRAKLLASVGRAMEAAERAASSAGQTSLFSGPAEIAAVDYIAAAPWSERERLANEKQALGYYFSGHLFTEYATEARRLAPTRLADVRPAAGGPGARSDPIRIAGIIVSARSQNTRRGRMGVIVLDDGTAALELMVFSELFDRKRALLKEDTLVFVTGRVRAGDAEQRLSVLADDVIDLAEARARAQADLRIEVENVASVAKLKDTLVPYRVPGANGGNGSNGEVRAGASDAAAGCRVVLHVANSNGCADIRLPDAWRVRGDERLLEELRAQPRVRGAGFSYG